MSNIERARQDIWAVVPVKALRFAKQRLACAYAPGIRCELARLMLEDVLEALAGVADLGGILVVTQDAQAARLARSYGARILGEPSPASQTAAVLDAARHLVREGRDGMLAVPGDVPGMTACEVEQLLEAHRHSRGVTIVPAHDHRGTNAIVMSPPDVIPLSFGDDSCALHVLTARAAGIEPLILPLAGIGLDLDHPEDVLAYSHRASSTRTWRFLHAHGMAALRNPGLDRSRDIQA